MVQDARIIHMIRRSDDQMIRYEFVSFLLMGFAYRPWERGSMGPTCAAAVELDGLVLSES